MQNWKPCIYLSPAKWLAFVLHKLVSQFKWEFSTFSIHTCLCIYDTVQKSIWHLTYDNKLHSAMQYLTTASRFLTILIQPHVCKIPTTFHQRTWAMQEMCTFLDPHILCLEVPTSCWVASYRTALWNHCQWTSHGTAPAAVNVQQLNFLNGLSNLNYSNKQQRLLYSTGNWRICWP